MNWQSHATYTKQDDISFQKMNPPTKSLFGQQVLNNKIYILNIIFGCKDLEFVEGCVFVR